MDEDENIGEDIEWLTFSDWDDSALLVSEPSATLQRIEEKGKSAVTN